MPIGGILQGVAALAQPLWQRSAQKKQFRQDRKMAEYAYSKDLEMWQRQHDANLEFWNMENQYNRPSAQMQRLRDAGLNPNLVAGGAGSVGQAGSISTPEQVKYNAPSAPKYNPIVDIPAMISQFQDVALKSAQINQMKAVTKSQEIKNDNDSFFSHGDRYRKMMRESRELEYGKYSANAQRGDAIRIMSDALFSRHREQLAKQGIFSGDNPVLRLLAKQLMEAGWNVTDILKGFVKPKR